MIQDPSIDSVLEFWFGALHDGFSDELHRKSWFSGGIEMDDAIQKRFKHLVTDAQNGEITSWLDGPRGHLAFILVCDQFPRNIFRGHGDAFSCDGLALEVAKDGIELGVDRELQYDERAFFYLPFEHSEKLTDQHTCVGLYSKLRDDTPNGQRQLTGAYLRFAHQHRDIIEKFGRFPHRNAALERTSTEQEQSFIAGGGGFGQQPR